MLVKDWMTPEPLAIAPDTPILEALKLLKARGFRRLPVVEHKRVVGMVTDKDLKDAMPSKATTLSVWELNHLLSSLSVSEVMAKPVLTAKADETLEDAALRMQSHKVAGLPVVNEHHHLVGILTITDVLDALLVVLGLKEGGTRLVLDLPDVPGALAKVVEAVQPANIVSVATAGHHHGQRQVVMRVVGDDIAAVRERLRVLGLLSEGVQGG
jgi:acetoin utilization protein AcuB